jgi:thioredoxin 1
MSTIQELNKTNFTAAISDPSSPILVDFWAPWCGPCRMLTPELEAVAEEAKGKVRVAKVNVDEDPELAEKYGVSSIPNLILFKKGQPIRQMVGFANRNELREAIL